MFFFKIPGFRICFRFFFNVFKSFLTTSTVYFFFHFFSLNHRRAGRAVSSGPPGWRTRERNPQAVGARCDFSEVGGSPEKPSARGCGLTGKTLKLQAVVGYPKNPHCLCCGLGFATRKPWAASRELPKRKRLWVRRQKTLTS